MRILIISHNIFSDTFGMGKTLSGYFKDFDPDEIAQFYIHSEIPTSQICKNYYRITDQEMIVSIFKRRSGKIYGEADIHLDSDKVRTDKGIVATLYQKAARSRAPLVYILRNLWWSLGVWNTRKLKRWIDNFKPDCVFFASGDYSFMYKIALKIAKKNNIPLIVSCMDDYYFNNQNEGRFLGKLTHRLFMKQVHKTMEYAFGILTICDTMTADYQKLFNKTCYTIHTSSTIEKPLNFEKKKTISYIGNLSLQRDRQLLDIAKALKMLNIDDAEKYIDVYSTESHPEILSNLTEENGIRFQGKASAEEVLQIMGESLAVIHTESFDPAMRKRVKYSVSTKIADSLASGTPLLAYGPKEIASMRYLIDNDAAFYATDFSELENVLVDLMNNETKRQKVIQHALELAKVNHANKNAGNMIKSVIYSAVQRN